MSGKVYLRQPDGTLRAMTESPFEREDLLQGLLENYPDLLAGDQMNPDEPRRFILVCREMGVPDDLASGNRWSIDHLFLDQDGVPTLVEVKRGSDTRIRREVVGQMLDYAANAVVYWPVDSLRALWEQRCERISADPDEALVRMLGIGSDDVAIANFWEGVKTNLQAGRIRLVFLADEVPPEPRRVVEFLNGQMDPAEVLAVEVRQFVGEGHQSLVPRVIGQTANAQQRKGTSPRPQRRWDEQSFLAEMERRNGPAARRVSEELLAWLRPIASRIWWGRGLRDGSFGPAFLSSAGDEYYPFTAWTNGSIEIVFQYLREAPYFNVEAHRREYLERLRRIPGVDLPADSHDRRPSFPIATLASADAMAEFKHVIEWFVESARQADSRS